MSKELNPRMSMTYHHNRSWVHKKSVKRERFLRRTFKENPEDIPYIRNLIRDYFPDEGRKLIENFDALDFQKKKLLIEFIVKSPQITCLILGDQRRGKDCLLTRIFEDIIEYCKFRKMVPPRIVSLGNVKIPPFVDPKDMYFSFKEIPFGTSFQPVYIYCSEIEVEFPARDFASEENKMFSILEGTLAQNHQKIFGCVKLTSKVDISVLRSCNVKLFKFVIYHIK